MIKLKNIIIISVIGIAVIISGCTGGQERKVTETAKPTPAQTTYFQPTIFQTTAAQVSQDPYQVQVIEVRTLPDCIKSPGSSEIQPCTLINLQVKNNNVKSLDFKLVNEEVDAKSSKVLPGKYDKEVGLNDLCTTGSGMEFVLTENTQKIIGLCHPTINNAEGPTLKIDTLINGVRKEYKFDVTS
ncbi:MAG TPA: hypothetical protein HA257_03435 [Candidatus Methanoperedenaceae archaeon]|nr:hypothetical protein [Candidatus Methanoperedenaceae archaeon]